MCISSADEPAERGSIFRSCWFFAANTNSAQSPEPASATLPALCLNDAVVWLYQTCLSPTFSSHFYKQRHLRCRGFSPTSCRLPAFVFLFVSSRPVRFLLDVASLFLMRQAWLIFGTIRYIQIMRFFIFLVDVGATNTVILAWNEGKIITIVILNKNKTRRRARCTKVPQSFINMTEIMWCTKKNLRNTRPWMRLGWVIIR